MNDYKKDEKAIKERLKKILKDNHLNLMQMSEGDRNLASLLSSQLNCNVKLSLKVLLLFIHHFPNIPLQWIINGEDATPDLTKRIDSLESSVAEMSKELERFDEFNQFIVEMLSHSVDKCKPEEDGSDYDIDEVYSVDGGNA